MLAEQESLMRDSINIRNFSTLCRRILPWESWSNFSNVRPFSRLVDFKFLGYQMPEKCLHATSCFSGNKGTHEPIGKCPCLTASLRKVVSCLSLACSCEMRCTDVTIQVPFSFGLLWFPKRSREAWATVRRSCRPDHSSHTHLCSARPSEFSSKPLRWIWDPVLLFVVSS